MRLLLVLVLLGACRPPEPVWLSAEQLPQSRGPFLVAWDHAEWDEHSDSVREAMDMFPCNMFREWRPGGDGVNVLLTVSDTVEGRGHLGEAWKVGPSTGGVAVAPLALSDIALSYVVVAHELGHFAGLAHDRVYGDREPFVSVMTPVVQRYVADRPGNGLWLPMLSNKDTDSLREVYCNE